MSDPVVTAAYLPPSSEPVSGARSPPSAEAGARFLATFGEYERLELVAEGGMGVVYRAWHPQLQRFEAVKLIRAGQLAGAADLARFQLEVEAGAALDHPNIVPVRGAGQVDGQPYLAMKWVEGGSLSEHLAEFREQPRESARLVAKLARAILYSHQRGILHRDLKPGNILLDATGEPLVTDFGLAKRLDVDAGLTATGAVAGTPSYMAPEQARGQKSLTVAADTYALGAVLYALLTGRPPFQGPNVVAVLEQVVDSPPHPPRAFNPLVDADLEAICLKCLEKEPGQRYASAAALADDLSSYLRGEPITACAPGMWDWLRQVMRTRPRQAPDYSWPTLVVYGGITLLVHTAIFVVVQWEGAAAWVWAILLTGLLSVCLSLSRQFRRFRWLPGIERHSVMVALGVHLATLSLAIVLVPWANAPAREALRLYPSLACVAGLGLFAHGAMHWSRLYLMGLGVIALAPILAHWPNAAPLTYGAVLTLCFWSWAYSLATTFGNPGVEPANNLSPDSENPLRSAE